jgi:hypothetical protein
MSVFWGDEPRGNGDGFGVGAVEEQQIFTKIFLNGVAMKTTAARRGIGHDHTVADSHPPSSELPAPNSEIAPASSWPKTAGAPSF